MPPSYTSHLCNARVPGEERFLVLLSKPTMPYLPSIPFRWRNQAVSYTAAADLVPLLELYVTKVHKLLASARERMLFIHHGTGTALTLSRLNTAWRKLLSTGEVQASFPPRRLRFIFFSDRMENPDVPGPSNDGAAAAAANSFSAWTRYYAKHYKGMRAQQAVNAMKEYREACRVRLAEKQAAIEEQRQREAEAAGPSVGVVHPLVEILDVLEVEEEEGEVEGGDDLVIELLDSDSDLLTNSGSSSDSDSVAAGSGGYETVSTGMTHSY